VTTFTRADTFEVFHCANCGVPYAVTKDFEQRRRSDKKSFYCPNGHTQWFGGETDADRAQRLAGQLDQERTRNQQLRDEAEARRRQLDYQKRARKAVSTRLRGLKQRVGNGVCPCCNRTFSQLARHMAAEHPTYAAEVHPDE
jgi:hypothetical protein